jgi:DNA-directed RNA polymerase
MYKNVDVLSNFYNDLETVLPELEKPPELGSLNIDGVLDSKYFFS